MLPAATMMGRPSCLAQVAAVFMLFATTLLPVPTAATLGPMCCGDNYCCALTAAKSIWCWGGNQFTVQWPSPRVMRLASAQRAAAQPWCSRAHPPHVRPAEALFLPAAHDSTHLVLNN